MQIENEYYGLIRPKRIARQGERPTLAIKRRGVEYLEVRCLDVNPFSPIGIDEETIRFLDVFLLFCLLEPSPFLSHEQMRIVRDNHRKVAMQGRLPELKLKKEDGEVGLQEWANELLKKLTLVAGIMDRTTKDFCHQEVLEKQWEKVRDANLTPSAILLSKLMINKKSFSDYFLALSKEHSHFLKQKSLSQKDRELFQKASQDSFADQKKIEETEKGTLNQYIEDYFKGFL